MDSINRATPSQTRSQSESVELFFERWDPFHVQIMAITARFASDEQQRIERSMLHETIINHHDPPSNLTTPRPTNPSKKPTSPSDQNPLGHKSPASIRSPFFNSRKSTSEPARLSSLSDQGRNDQPEEIPSGSSEPSSFSPPMSALGTGWVITEKKLDGDPTNELSGSLDSGYDELAIEPEQEEEWTEEEIPILDSKCSATIKLCGDWFESIISSLKIETDSLPDPITRDDIQSLRDHLPSSIHLELIHDLVFLSLASEVASTNQSSSSAELDEKASSTPLSNHKQKTAFRYTALNRRLVFLVAELLAITPDLVYNGEKLVAQQLFFIMQDSQTKSSSDHTDSGRSRDDKLNQASRFSLLQAASSSKWVRYIGTGAGVIIGGVTIGLTGGLAAPVLAPLLVTISGGAFSFLATSGGAILIGTLFGVAGGGLTGYRAQRRLKGIEDFSFVRLPLRDETQLDPELPAIPSLHATILCSGFLLTPTDYIDSWIPAFKKTIDDRDVYAIKLETEAFLSAGRRLDNFIRDTLLRQGASEIIKRTALASIYTAILLPAAIYKAASMALDNDFQRARDKCEKAAILLADMIEQEAHGTRPLILIGSSMGAITIFETALELSRRNLNNSIDQIILISSPLSPRSKEWKLIKKVVKRRIVNVYNKNDWVLAILARLHGLISQRMSINVSGLYPVKLDGIESIDISDLLDGHLKLNKNLAKILERVGLNR